MVYEDFQKPLFEQQFQVAADFNRVANIHCVRASGDLLQFLARYPYIFTCGRLVTTHSQRTGFQRKQLAGLEVISIINETLTLTLTRL